MLDIFSLNVLLEPSTILGIGALITAAVSTIMVIITVKQNSHTKYLQFIKDVDNEISVHLKDEISLQNREACLVHAYNYVDLCDRVLFLIKKKMISESLLNYYLDFFAYASTMMWWYAKSYPEDTHSFKYSWPTLTNWILNTEIDVYPVMHLPNAMKDLLDDNNPSLTGAQILGELRNLINARKS